ncbi:hypothetical protein BDU57DRAFT_346620 [Ampelomyces quisqualis]|uniref:Secreted protein n=1 Tax=Ampelomyces quisqualis TaxID=50730 RepID=A0A6A5QCR6_AMPQU|nr:hypothetical protein BDU57DRAFT_346620 [Ampelomyces quisqualis]
MGSFACLVLGLSRLLSSVEVEEPRLCSMRKRRHGEITSLRHVLQGACRWHLHFISFSLLSALPRRSSLLRRHGSLAADSNVDFPSGAIKNGLRKQKHRKKEEQGIMSSRATFNKRR